jgi:branched-chain amino acid transport system permease protein
MASTTATAGLLKPRIRLGEAVERGIALAIVVAGVVWVIINFVEEPKLCFSVLLDGLNRGALYALIALGYTLVYGIIELINFAHGDLFMLGTVFSANLLINWLGVKSATFGGILALILTFVVTMAFCAAINVSAEFFAYRRLRRAPRLAPLITAVGLSFVFQNIGLKWNGSTPKQWPSLIGNHGFTVAGVLIRYSLFVTLSVTALLLFGLTFIIQRTRQGKAMRATAQDQDGARLMGINVDRTISFTFALGGAMAGTAGVLWIETYGSTRFDLGFQLGLMAFTAAVLGGIGNLVGAVVGGVLIGLVQAFNEGFPHGLGQDWTQTVVFSILILLLVFKPEGLFGQRTTEKV